MALPIGETPDLSTKEWKRLLKTMEENKKKPRDLEKENKEDELCFKIVEKARKAGTI
jgi:hypothetical protein